MRRLVAAVMVALIAGCGPGLAQPARQSRVADADWPVFGGTTDNTRYSPLGQINASDVSQLRVAWTRDEGFGQSTWESFPVVVGTTMYLTTSTDAVWAVNAATGALRWSYAPVVDFFRPDAAAGATFPANRGVAVAGGLVYELTFDCHLLAIDARTGQLRWRVKVADPAQGYYETTAPIAWGGIVFVGSSGGDSGARGFIAAYDARAGRQLWRRYTVPAPGHGWMPAAGHHGGGAVWMPPVIDTATGILYAATGNPSPDFTGAARPGADPDTDGILALRARTGQLVWFTSLVRHDISDYDAASPPVLFRAAHAIGEAGKSGFFYLLDVATGRPLHPPARFVATGAASTVTCPADLGGSNYAPVGYDQETGLAYISGIDYCGTYHRETPAQAATHQAGTPDQGGDIQPAQPAPTGTFTAIDVTTGRIRWQRSIPAPMLGGATVAQPAPLASGQPPSAGLVFAGSADGTLYAFDASTGAIRWQRNMAAGFGSAPVLYATGGREYLSVVSGGAAIAAINHLGPVGGRLYTFTIPP